VATETLKGSRVAILVDNGFEEVEMTKPRQALNDEGAVTHLVSPQDQKVRAWDFTDWSNYYPVDMRLNEADPQNYDALLLPGGVLNPDSLRMQPKAVQFVKAFFAAGKPVASICHGPWTVIETGAVRGRRVTSWPSLRTDLKNAGGEWVDREAVVDGNFVTSRKPDDIPAFNREMITLFAAAHSRSRQAA
jgi:protease I